MILVNEDFSTFNVGDFPFEPLLGAMGEYHYRPYPGNCGIWYDPSPVMGTGGFKMWLITKTFPMDGSSPKKCLEYSAVVKEKLADMLVLATGEYSWNDYTYTAKVQPLLQKGFAGILFRYQDSRSFYALSFHNGTLELKVKKHEYEKILAAKPFNYSGIQEKTGENNFYNISIECKGSHITCKLENEIIFQVEDRTFSSGRIAVGATAPCRFTDIKVEMDDACYNSIIEKEKKQKAVDTEIVKNLQLPSMKIRNKIDLKDFGAGRNIRFGHLCGGKKWFIVVAQCQMRVHRDAYAHISCLTALDLDGNILWQQGEADNSRAFITCDLPFQVYDIDNDGKDEVICAIDLSLRILDGETGKVKSAMALPQYTPEKDEENLKKPIGRYAFDFLNSDGIRICNFSGNKHPSDILLKDRYKRVWAYDKDFNLMWTHTAKVSTGHYGYALDIDGDGKDEFFIGYDLLDHDGKLLWSLPVNTDHTDEIIIGPVDPDRVKEAIQKGLPKERGYIIGCVSGSEGFILSDVEGNVIMKDFIGHAQRISTGNFRTDLPGNEICVVTFWGNQGIIRLYDCKGNLLWSMESKVNGNVITPVSWGRKKDDFILLNASLEHGGIIDGYGRKVLSFPEDGHPETCCEVLDINENGEDSLVVWDEKSLWIYEADYSSLTDNSSLADNTLTDNSSSNLCKNSEENLNIDKKEKMPYWNASNYRGEYSYRSGLFKGER